METPLVACLFIVEVVFFFYAAWRHHIVSRTVSKPLPYPTSRKRLFSRILSYIAQQNEYDAKQWISAWFLGVPFERVRQQNLEVFFTWAFFATTPSKINSQERREVKEMVATFCSSFNIQMEPGFTPDLPCVRLNLDAIAFSHRPLLYYAAIFAVQQACGLVLLAAGFEHGSVDGISYWWRGSSSSLPKSEDRRTQLQEPLLFFHGIGIGLAPYLQLLSKLCARQYFTSGSNRQWHQRGVLLVELPSIAQAVFKGASTESTPTPDCMVSTIRKIASLKRVQRFGIVAGHSFGSIPVAWLVRKAPDLVGSTLFIDPVCFLLFLPDVGSNFLYRKPTTLIARLISALASRELYTANALHRHFWWYCNVLWADDVPSDCPALVVLSSADCIVPAAKVRSYLDESPNISTMWLPGMNHGQVLVRPDLQNKVAAQMMKMEHKQQSRSSKANMINMSRG